MPVFAKIKENLGGSVLANVVESGQCEPLQLRPTSSRCTGHWYRQTDCLVATAKTWKVVNVKKRPLSTSWDMKDAIENLMTTGNPKVPGTKRSTSIGHNTLMTDLRSLPLIAAMSAPTMVDSTPAVQQLYGQGSSSGGRCEFIPVLARAAVAIDVEGGFIETHLDPDNGVAAEF